MNAGSYPGGKNFGFTVLNHAHEAPVATLRPIYELFEELGLRTTQMVCSFATAQSAAGTLDDPEYHDFIVELSERGFEIGWAGASNESNQRHRVIEGLERFREVLGCDPRVYVNHAAKRENLYWGNDRIDQSLLRAVIYRTAPAPAGYYEGHREDSPFWWGDICRERVEYVLNLTFDDINLSRINPSMPYTDPSRPFVKSWFSACDAIDNAEFNQLLRPDRQDKLEREAGCCLVATNLSRGFVRNQTIERLARKRFESIAAKSGWFVPVSTMLDHLKTAPSSRVLPTEEWDRMQWKWARDTVRRGRRVDLRRSQTTADVSNRGARQEYA
jgi:hypothetical protein